MKKRSIPEEDDQLILDEPSPTVLRDNITPASNNRKTSLTSNSSPSDASNRLENQISKNLMELSSSTPPIGGTGINTTSFTQNPNSEV